MTTTDPTPADKLMRNLLEANVVFMAKAMDPKTPEAAFLSNSMAGHYAGAAAFLLDQLRNLDGERAVSVARELDLLMELGEPLADWAGEAAAEVGIEVDELIACRLTEETTTP